MRGCFRGVRTLLASYVLSDTSLCAGYVSAASLRRNYLRRNRTKLGRLCEFNQTLDALVTHGILKAKGDVNPFYTLNPDRPDFFTLYLRKKVRVSPGYHRSMALHARLIALRSNIGEYETGTFAWLSWQYKPSVVVRRPRRLGLASSGGNIRWKIQDTERNSLRVNLVFDPPLRMGEIVEYGFYTWTREYYARSRADALERFGEEWVREGLLVRNETEFIELVVVPHRKYQTARVDVDAQESFTKPGWNGRTLKTFETGEDTLVWSCHHPETARYFIAWIPPTEE